ncbi:MAG: hypothetical protein R2745_15320 [Vicinamibacterales bacterium]
MTRQQRFKYEMFVRVRDFGAAHATLFPEATKGGQAFARVVAAVAAIDKHAKNHVIGRAEARRIKTETREAVFESLKTIAAAARRVTRVEPSVSPFVLPPHRSLGAELATARAFMEAAATRQSEFEQFGLPSTFISDFRTAVDRLQQAADVRLSSKTVRRKAQAGIATTLAEGLDAARDLDVIVDVARGTREDGRGRQAALGGSEEGGQELAELSEPARTRQSARCLHALQISAAQSAKNGPARAGAKGRITPVPSPLLTPTILPFSRPAHSVTAKGASVTRRYSVNCTPALLYSVCG